MAPLDFPEQQVLVHFFGRKKKGTLKSSAGQCFTATTRSSCWCARCQKWVDGMLAFQLQSDALTSVRAVSVWIAGVNPRCVNVHVNAGRYATGVGLSNMLMAHGTSDGARLLHPNFLVRSHPSTTSDRRIKGDDHPRPTIAGCPTHCELQRWCP